MTTVHVIVDDRYFIVEWDIAGELRRIKERKVKTKPMIGVFDTLYWDARHHSLGKKETTLPKRIIAAAVEKHAAS